MKRKAKHLPKRIWITANDLDVLEWPGQIDNHVYLTRKAAQEEADDCTSLGYPTHVVGPYVLAPNGGRRGRR